MSVEKIEGVNNNGGAAKSETAISTVKVFEVTTNVNEIITIKKEPLDFVEFTGDDVSNASANPLIDINKKSVAVSSSNVVNEDGVTVSYQIEKWNSTEASKYDDRIDSEEDIKDFEDEEEDIDLSGFDEDSDEEVQRKSISRFATWTN